MSVPAPRFDIELPVELRAGGSIEPFLGVSVNISSSGMLVLAEEERDRGTSVEFQFNQFGGTGEVIWTRTDEEDGTLLGMKFVTLKRKDRKTLERILASPTTVSRA